MNDKHHIINTRLFSRLKLLFNACTQLKWVQCVLIAASIRLSYIKMDSQHRSTGFDVLVGSYLNSNVFFPLTIFWKCKPETNYIHTVCLFVSEHSFTDADDDDHINFYLWNNNRLDVNCCLGYCVFAFCLHVRTIEFQRHTPNPVEEKKMSSKIHFSIYDLSFVWHLMPSGIFFGNSLHY